MKNKIEGKINEIIEHIISKPEDKITMDDYTVLKNELMDIRTREGKAENGKRMAELMATALSAPAGF